MDLAFFAKCEVNAQARAIELRKYIKDAQALCNKYDTDMNEALAEGNTERYADLYTRREAASASIKQYETMLAAGKKGYTDEDVQQAWRDWCADEAAPEMQKLVDAYNKARKQLVSAVADMAKKQNTVNEMRGKFGVYLSNGNLGGGKFCPRFTKEFESMFRDELCAIGLASMIGTPDFAASPLYQIMNGGVYDKTAF